MYQKVGYHLSFHFHFHFLSLFSSTPFLFFLPPLPLPPFVFVPLLSFPFPLHIPSNPARGPGERCKRRLCWLKSSQPRRRQSYCDKSSVSHIFHQSVTLLYVTDSGDYFVKVNPEKKQSAKITTHCLTCAVIRLSVSRFATVFRTQEEGRL